MVRDDLTIYTLDDLIEEGLTEVSVFEARERKLLVPRKCGNAYRYIGSEVCAAMEKMLQPAKEVSKEELRARHSSKSSGFAAVRAKRRAAKE